MLTFSTLAHAVGLPGLNASTAAPAAESSAATDFTPAKLADLLEDPATRDKLVEALRAHTQGSEGSAAPKAEPQDAEPSLPTRIAAGAQRFLANMSANAETAVDEVSAAIERHGMTPERRALVIDTLTGLAVVAAATWLVFWLLRLLASFAYARIDLWAARPVLSAAGPLRSAARAMLLRRAGAIVSALLIDLGLVALAGAAGYATAMYATQPYGNVTTAQSLFVNAFVAVGLTRAAIRGVFATRYPTLRLFTMADDGARYWNARLGHIAAVIGYALLLIEPLAQSLLSPALGELLGFIIMLMAYLYAVRIIWRNRARVGAHLKTRAERATIGSFGTALRLLARTWHFLAIGYFTVLLVVSQIDNQRALPFMMMATMQSLAALAVGSLVSLLLESALSRRIRLPEDLRRKLPMLEDRVNAYVPAGLRGLGLLVRIMVALFVLDAWRVFDLSSWIVSDAGTAAVRVVVNVIIVLFVAAVVWTIIASIIEHRLSLREGRGMPTARERTLLSLFRNAVLIVIVTMTVMVVLSQIGVDIAPLIAGAGVVGLAIGFGSQKLVQDIITGIFIQLENGMNQNDVVQVAGIFGTVEKITIRSVGIRTLDGGYHLIPFSSVDVVSNHMRDFSYHLGEYTISHRESVDDAVEHLRRAFDELMQDEVLAPEVLEEISIPGVTALNEKGVTIRVLIKTTPGMQWAVQRGYNRLVKKHFNAAGIELPYPHTVLYFGQDKNGYAPPANVFMQTESAQRTGKAFAPGHTPRHLSREQGEASEDVLGNELERVVEPDADAEAPVTAMAAQPRNDRQS
ncbi:mechanosensitive ion channel domain-containing protein [Bordetella sp. 02P26C-1]|uniref:mechanosensitive ion channel domain-containing protein n=1 Tax=Bordetella sp. 02P26C-1 TaxID=2683195 RepID=UPI001355DE57|nr:mechanosensitive ion channel domain-containing protein [Bordetella sp. 02P26C-1]MVW79831.1 mechanosensitive ion channel [Bordetella sp. 02P26C-1]